MLHLQKTTLSILEPISPWHLTHFVFVLYKAWNMFPQGLQIDLNTAVTNMGIILHEHYLIYSQEQISVLPLQHVYIACVFTCCLKNLWLQNLLASIKDALPPSCQE